MKVVLNKRPVAFCAFFAAVGIAAAYYLQFYGVPTLVLLIICASLFFLLLFRGNKRALFALYAAAFFAGAFLFGQAYDVDYSKINLNTEYTVSARVSNRERMGQDTKKYTLSGVTLTDGQYSIDFPKDAVLYTPDVLEYGDLVEFDSKVTPPSIPRNPGGYDEKMYLAASGAGLSFYAYEIRYRGNEPGFYGAALYVRETLAASIDEIYTPETAPFAKAMLLGIKDEIPAETREAFSQTGAAHVLAISGLHVGILFALLDWLLRKAKMSRSARFITEIALLLCYAFITAFAVSVVRAVLMCIFVIVGRWKFLKRDTLTYLCAALLAILVFFPAQLFMPGLLMSFGTVFGLLCLMPPLTKWWKRVRFDNAFSSALSVSSAASIAVAPLTAYYFGNIVWIAPLTNFVAIPLATIIVIFSGISAFAALLWIPLAKVFAFVSGMSITLLLFFNTQLAQTGIGSVAVADFPVYLGVLVFAILFICSGYVIAPKKAKAAVCAALGAVIVAVSALGAAHTPALRVTVLDVGTGDAIHIHTEGGDLLIDNGGSMQYSNLTAYAEAGDISFDMVVVSNDRTNDLGGLIDQGRVGRMVVPKNYIPKENEQNLDSTSYGLYDKIGLGGDVYLQAVATDDKHFSFALYQGGKALCLFMQTDAAELGQAVSAPVLKLSGGGGEGSVTQELLEESGTRYAVISASQTAKGLPDPEVAALLDANGIAYANTAQSGAVIIEADRAGNMEITTMK